MNSDYNLHYNYIESDEKSECIHCHKKYQGRNWSNLKRHLIAKHPSHATESNISFRPKRASDQLSNEDNPPTKKLKKMEPREFIQACVELATINLLPFNFFTFEATKKLIASHESSTGVTINYPNIRKFVHLSAEKIKNVIKEEVTGRMVALKIDTATRLGRSILGVNIQFYSMSLDKIIVRTLGIIEIKKKHTSQNINLMIGNILDDYNIDKRSISSITCDNGANIIASAKLFQDRQNSLLLNDEIEEYRDSLLNVDEDDEDDMECFDEFGPTEIPQNIKDALNGISCIAVLVRCSIHTLQLGVHDALREVKNKYGIQLQDIRNVVKSLKSSTYADKIESLNIKIPGIDICTRWNSSFIMVHQMINLKEDLLKLYEYYSGRQLDAIKINEVHWNFMTEFHPAFLPCFNLTQKLQKVNIGMGIIIILLLFSN